MELGKIVENPNSIEFELNEILVIDFLHKVYDLSCFQKESEYPIFITLADISNKYPKGCYKVIIENPMGGKIYRYNNYGKNEWQLVGTMYGYA